MSIRSGIKWGEYQQFQFYEFTSGKHPKECVSVVTPHSKQGRAIPCVKESISVAFWGAACVDRVQQS